MLINRLLFCILMFSSLGSSNFFSGEDTYIDKLLFRLVKHESNFNSHAVSKKGARGTWQIMPDTLRDFNQYNKYGLKYTFDDMFDPHKCAIVGNWNFQRNYRYYKGDMILTVNAYNMGIGNTDKKRFASNYLFQLIAIEWIFYRLKNKNVLTKSKSYYIIPLR